MSPFSAAAGGKPWDVTPEGNFPDELQRAGYFLPILNPPTITLSNDKGLNRRSRSFIAEVVAWCVAGAVGGGLAGGGAGAVAGCIGGALGVELYTAYQIIEELISGPTNSATGDPGPVGPNAPQSPSNTTSGDPPSKDTKKQMAPVK